MQANVASSERRNAEWRQRVWAAVHAARTHCSFIEASNVQAHESTDQLTLRGWRAIREQSPAQAEVYFRAVIHREPYAVSAWLGLSRVVESAAERRIYLQVALDLHQLVVSVEHAH